MRHLLSLRLERTRLKRHLPMRHLLSLRLKSLPMRHLLSLRLKRNLLLCLLSVQRMHITYLLPFPLFSQVQTPV
ncbi:hypothetical protein D7V77_42605 [Corallococcus sp. CA041A]|nr:hypothetical protein D7V77_42605 [Corallococcus sp. CA041A]